MAKRPPPSSTVVRPRTGPGRASLYTDALGDTICREIAAGETISNIIEGLGISRWETVAYWAVRNPGFGAKLAEARRVSALRFEEKIIERMESVTTAADAVAARVQADNWRWLAQSRSPALFNPNRGLTPDTGPAQVIDARSLSAEARRALRDALSVQTIDGEIDG